MAMHLPKSEITSYVNDTIMISCVLHIVWKDSSCALSVEWMALNDIFRSQRQNVIKWLECFQGRKAFEDHKYIFILSFTILLVRSNIVILYVVVKRCSDSCILNKLSNLKIRYFGFLWWDGLKKVLLGNLLFVSPYEGKEKIFQQTGFEVLLTPWFTLCKKKKKKKV